jgi:hypothetical protein
MIHAEDLRKRLPRLGNCELCSRRAKDLDRLLQSHDYSQAELSLISREIDGIVKKHERLEAYLDSRNR